MAESNGISIPRGNKLQTRVNFTMNGEPLVLTNGQVIIDIYDTLDGKQSIFTKTFENIDGSFFDLILTKEETTLAPSVYYIEMNLIINAEPNTLRRIRLQITNSRW